MYMTTTLCRPNPRTTRLLNLTHDPIRIHLDDHLIHLDPNHTILPIITIDIPLTRLLDPLRLHTNMLLDPPPSNLHLTLALLRILLLNLLDLVLLLESCLSPLIQSLVFLLPSRRLVQTVNR